MSGHIPALPAGRALDWNGLHDGQTWNTPPGIAWQARLDQNGGGHVVCLNLEGAGEAFPDALGGDRPWRDSLADALADARALEAEYMATVRALQAERRAQQEGRNGCAALPRCEAALRLAEAEANNLDGWDNYTDDDDGRELRARNHAELVDAIAAYRRGRS